MNKKYFDIAYEQAKKAFDLNEVPIGAIIVKDNEIISSAFNMKEFDNCCTSHAELIAIQEASKKFNNWRLDGCDIYITLDPCPMCASAIKQARISNVYSALKNTDESYYRIINDIFSNNDSTSAKLNFVTNLDVEKSKTILNKFFKKQRKK